MKVRISWILLTITAVAFAFIYFVPDRLMRDEMALRKLVTRIEPRKLLDDSRILAETTAKNEYSPDANELPDSFRQLKPVVVRRYDNTFYIVTRRGFGQHEIGILVQPLAVPDPGTRSGFISSRIAPGVYFFAQ
jgi:hypothetical protein